MHHPMLRISLCAAAAAMALGIMSVKPARSQSMSVTAASSVSSQAEPVGQSDAFVDSIGADSKFSYLGSSYTVNWPTISAELIKSGMRHLRDSAPPTPDYLERMATLGAHGIDHSAGFSVNATPHDIVKYLARFTPYIGFVEPQNEYDSRRNQDPNWANELVASQKTLYTTVHGNPAFKGITVLGPPLAHQQLYASLGALDQYEDAGNLHYAPCDFNPGVDIPSHQGIRFMHSLVRASTQTKPIWTTEAGYNDMTHACQVPDDIIAKYDPRTIAVNWNHREPRTYFYQLVDLPSDPTFGHMGLISSDGSPKPQFTALASLIHVLEDRGRPFAPAPLHYVLSGDTAHVDRTLLEKRDGRYELLLWLEVPGWKSLDNHRSGVPIDVPAQSVSLTLPASVSSARIYQYTPDWQLKPTRLPVQSRSVHFKVTDSISVIELR